MLKTISTIAVLCTLSACVNNNIPKDVLNKDLLNEAKPLYQSCLAEYKKTMFNDDAKKACTKKLKSNYKKISKT